MIRKISNFLLKPLVTSTAILSLIAWSHNSERVEAATLSSAPGYDVSVFAQKPTFASSPDSIVVDGSNVYVSYSNGVAPDGSDGKSSTIVDYTTNGQIVRTFSVLGSNDGLRLDPTTHLLWALSNQDGNPQLRTIDPTTGTQTLYNFSSTAHGGGYDDIAFINGKAFISGSNPTLNSAGVNTSPSLYTATLVGNSVQVNPVLNGNATAVDRTTGKTVNLNLTDPDALAVDPQGHVILAGQADKTLAFVGSPGTAEQKVSSLSTGKAVDDTLFAPQNKGSILVTDSKGGDVYKVSGDFVPGTAYSAATSGSLDTLNLQSGNLTPVVNGLNSPHGLAFIPESSAQAVPEPNSVVGLLALGVLGTALRLKRRQG